MRLFVTLLCCCCAFAVIAQVAVPADPLEGTKGKERLTLLNDLTRNTEGKDYRKYFDEAMALADEMKDLAGKVDALCAAGDHFHHAGNAANALSLYNKALETARLNNLIHGEIMSLGRLAWAHELSDRNDLARKLYMESINVARSKGSKKDLASSLEQMAIFYLEQRNYDEALQTFTSELEVDEAINDSSAIAACLNNIGMIHFNKGNYAGSIIYYQRSADIKKKLGETEDAASVLVNIGITYREQGIYDKALESLLEAARYFERSDSFHELASCYNTIGNVQLDLGSPEKALSFHFKALDIREKIGNETGVAGSLNNIGQVYMHKKQYELALEFLHRSLKKKEKLGDKKLLASTLDRIGEVYYLTEDMREAERFLLRSLRLKNEIEDLRGAAITHNKLGQLYLLWNKFEPCFDQLDKGRTIARSLGAKAVLLENCEISARAYQEKGDAKKVFEYYQLHAQLKDSILNDQKSRALAEMDVKYETERKEQEIALLNEKSKADAAVLEQQQVRIYSFYAITALLVGLIGAGARAYTSGKKVTRQKEELIRQKQAMIDQKQVMMNEAHHRIKNNLQMLLSMLSLQQGRVGDESTKTALKAVESRLNAMILIHQDLYGEDNSSQVSIRSYITRLVNTLLDSYAARDKVKADLMISEAQVEWDKALNIGFITNEVISNAFKHAFAHTAHALVTVTLKAGDGTIALTISDNGSGISPGRAEKSSSFGLRLVQMFVKDLKGTMSMSSSRSGTSFEFTIPNNQQTLIKASEHETSTNTDS